ncbi:MAG: YicC family protein [Gammaproteobacteria bacterium]|nr:YicC family protein [Gammaproteobacteria bacterium]
MICSMTAFARHSVTLENGELTWELRSVNHRYLELSVRIPDEIKALEPRIRELCGKHLKRGKVECSLRLKSAVTSTTQLVINEVLSQQLIEHCASLNQQLEQAAPISAMDILRWPGVTQMAPPDYSAIHEQTLTLLDGTLRELHENRGREGEKLKAFILRRCDAMSGWTEQVKARLPEVLNTMRSNLHSRIEKIAAEVDASRLEQEIAHLLQKMDVDEELDRLDSHIQEVRRVLDLDEPVGRRLDFLMQELNREVNTLGSKSSDAEMTRIGVELKVLVEQMREQVQNIE